MKSPAVVMVLGYGTIGATIVDLLLEMPEDLIKQVLVVDNDYEKLKKLTETARVVGLPGSAVTDPIMLTLKSPAFAIDVVINALPHHGTAAIARHCLSNGVHYFDLTEDVGEVKKMRWMGAEAEDKGVLIAPQQGLAPGAINVIGVNALKKVDKPFSLSLYVGALTEHDYSPMNYAFTWSMDGLVNEYYHSSKAILSGQFVDVPALSLIEKIRVENVDYEAATTAGGLGSLPHDLRSYGLENLTYKTLRFPGHWEKCKFLIEDLKIPQPALKEVFKGCIPWAKDDVVVMAVRSAGDNGYEWTKKISGNGRHSAIQLTTASGLLATLELFLKEKIKTSGFLSHVDIPADEFLATQHGSVYK